MLVESMPMVTRKVSTAVIELTNMSPLSGLLKPCVRASLKAIDIEPNMSPRNGVFSLIWPVKTSIIPTTKKRLRKTPRFFRPQTLRSAILSLNDSNLPILDTSL
jgi:hypothetical protein